MHKHIVRSKYQKKQLKELPPVMSEKGHEGQNLTF